MARYRLAVLPGDDIGPETVTAAQSVLETAARTSKNLAFAFTELPVGMKAYRQHGSTLPDLTRTQLPDFDGWILGAVTTHQYDGSSMPNPSAALRTGYSLYANIRPARSYTAIPSVQNNVDLVVVRENTEGFYADRNMLDGPSEFRPDEDTVISMRLVTRKGSERIARSGFELAMKRRKKVTLVHKANVLKRGCGLFLEAARQVGQEYPDVEVDEYHVDAFAMHLVMRPQDFDIIVTTNLFGDVLSDQAAGLVGGLGMAPGLNVSDVHGMAQAVHGSAPDIAGKGIANPVAMILSGAMLLDWLGTRNNDEEAKLAGERIHAAVAQVLNQPGPRTPDLGGPDTTTRMTDAIIAALIS